MHMHVHQVCLRFQGRKQTWINAIEKHQKVVTQLLLNQIVIELTRVRPLDSHTTYVTCHAIFNTTASRPHHHTLSPPTPSPPLRRSPIDDGRSFDHPPCPRRPPKNRRNPLQIRPRKHHPNQHLTRSRRASLWPPRNPLKWPPQRVEHWPNPLNWPNLLCLLLRAQSRPPRRVNPRPT